MPVQTERKPKRDGKVLLQVWIDENLRDAIRDGARENGCTVQNHVGDLLDQAVSDIEQIDGEASPKKAKNAYRRLAAGAEEISASIRRLHTEIDELEAQIQEKTGWFENPPESLVKAKALLEAQLKALTKQCEELTQQEQKSQDDDDWDL